MSKENELLLPRTAVFKLIKDLLPSDVRCANDAKELIVSCCTEFIHLLTSESNDLCTKENKRTICPDHILKALKTLGFNEYVQAVEEVFLKHKQETIDLRKAKAKEPKHLMTQEELARKQQELFAADSYRYQNEAYQYLNEHPSSLEDTNVLLSSARLKQEDEDDYDAEE
ncbi:uncharacterized protein LOC135145510 [Zophobas morio]|uniref:uncharacterized protein LOC135145510 n=1 Tax=Zophobas morio TaxID=2755281 RepID=UPI003083AB2E